MPWGAIAGALISGAASLYGASRQNQANSAQAYQQMAFNQAAMHQDQDFTREMFQRQGASNWDFMRAQEAFQRGSAHDAMVFNREERVNQQDFQRETMNSAMAFDREMSNTSYQRGMADMKAAGLNPMLAYKQGGATAPTIGAMPGGAASAPSPSGSSQSAGLGRAGMASGAQARMENTMAPMVSAAFQGARLLTELDQLEANVKRTEAETLLVGEQSRQVQANTALQSAQLITEGVRPDLIRAQRRTEEGRPALVGAQAAQATQSARSTAQQADDYRDYGPPSSVRDAAISADRIMRPGSGGERLYESLRDRLGRLYEIFR